VNWGVVATAVPLLVWIVGLVVVPQVGLLLQSFYELGGDRLTLANYLSIFQDSDFIFLRVFGKTLLYTLAIAALTLAVAYPMAFILAKVLRGRQKLVFILLLATPFWVNELIRVYAWIGLLRETGFVNYLLVDVLGVLPAPVELLYNDIAMVVVFVYSFLLLMLLPIYSSLDGLDDTLIQAAQNLGAGWFSVFRYVVWPASLPGVTAGLILVFTLGFSNYLVPTLVGGKNSLWVTQLIYNRFVVATNWNLGAAYSFILLAIACLVVWVLLKLTGQSLQNVFGN
jgi:spermidine/putrescine transport system permease protein